MSLHEADVVCTPVRTPSEIAHVGALAQQIWPEYYTPIIGTAQVDYMLRHFQSPAAIAAQMAEGQQYFLVRNTLDLQTPQDRDWTGYYSVILQPLSRRLFISKLYLLAIQRGKGLGRVLLDKIITMAKQNDLDTLWLTVNKNNPAFHIYLRWGFANKGPMVKDIGGGFVMDDFQLEKSV